MIDIEKVITKVSKRLDVDREIVDQVCKHVFKETMNVMKDENEYRDILFRNLMKFKLKGRFKLDKTKNYSPHEKVRST